MLLQYGPHFFSTLSEKFGQLERFFWANGLPPPLAKNFPYAYVGCCLFSKVPSPGKTMQYFPLTALLFDSVGIVQLTLKGTTI